MSRRGENIYKRKDGRWEARFIKGKDISGKTKYGYLYGRSYAEVKDKLCSVGNVQNDIFPKTENGKTVSQLCGIWLDEVKTQLKPSSYVKYRNLIKNHILPSIGSYKIQYLDTALVRKFADERLMCGNLYGGGLSAKTVKDILSVLRLVINYAANIGIICNVNFNAISIKSNDTNIEVLSGSQREKLSSHLISNMNNTNLGILMCLYTGMRIGEICALKFGDISSIDRVIHIRKTMQRIQNFSDDENKTNIIITPPKSKSSVRDIPLPDFIMDIIKSDFNCCEKAYLLSGDTNYVEPRTLENRFKAVIKKCGIENVNFHILRHTFATYSIEVGFETKSLSEILGHSSVNITLNRYVHSSMELKRANMAKLDFTPSEF